MFNVLRGIYEKNKKIAFSGAKEMPNSNLFNLLSLPLLVVAYKKIRKNKGATTLGYILSKDKSNKLNWEQKSFINKIYHLPDGINKRVFTTALKLIKEGKYPWGSSRRIYTPKPGRPDSLRPITIPHFMDRVVQAGILMILEAIYEPYFEKDNVSFGFRPNKGVHDAIFSLINNKSRGFKIALEGDIKSAYDKVCKNKLIEILNEKIKDRKFLNFIKQRLDYEYFDPKQKRYIREEAGIPQGGIDSPYLWNIYMSKFDEFVKKHTSEYLNQVNPKAKTTNRIYTSGRRVREKSSTKYRKMQSKDKDLH